ncbi:hypothetical protein C8R48DRAFT_672382 [Suillus tomentosus]|nr:hypothetical protein C8R48DRAFT_672382 [Suillus tomentosus]
MHSMQANWGTTVMEVEVVVAVMEMEAETLTMETSVVTVGEPSMGALRALKSLHYFKFGEWRSSVTPVQGYPLKSAVTVQIFKHIWMCGQNLQIVRRVGLNRSASPRRVLVGPNSEDAVKFLMGIYGHEDVPWVLEVEPQPRGWRIENNPIGVGIMQWCRDSHGNLLRSAGAGSETRHRRMRGLEVSLSLRLWFNLAVNFMLKNSLHAELLTVTHGDSDRIVLLIEPEHELTVGKLIRVSDPPGPIMITIQLYLSCHQSASPTNLKTK